MTQADSPEMVLLSVREDAGPFEQLGGQFTCNKARWMGKAVASPVAIYLLKLSKNNHAYGGGIAGVLLATALAKDDKLSTCTAEDLPPAIRKALDPKNKKGKKDVVIIPKVTVSYVKAGGWSGTIKVNAGADKFAVSTGLFRMFSRPKVLAAMGWTLNTELSPTVAPVHDMRSEEERAKSDRPLWLKILLVAGAALLVIGYIVLRIVADMH